jgi:hypothetical protein
LIANPSFELEESLEGIPVQITTFQESNSQRRGTPYGWSDINIEGLAPANPANPISYGINSQGNNQDGAKSCWALNTPFPDNFTLYQDINGLPAGKYQVSCSMYIQNDRLTTQRLFANNNVQYYGTNGDYELNLTDGETATYADFETSPDAFADGQFLRDLSVEVDIQAGVPLRIGVKSSNLKKDGTAETVNNAGWFRVDNFRLKQITTNQLNTIDERPFSIANQKGGFQLNVADYASTYLRVTTLSGQTVYSHAVTNTQTSVNLPQGLYIVQFAADGQQKAVKVLVY